MYKKEHTLWVEKYRSKTLNDYIGNESIKSIIQQYIHQNDLQNLIFYGPAGTGKTTLAKILTSNINCDSLYINASDERGIDTIRDKVSSFASSASFKPLKIIILDEADFLTMQAQASLRNIIETFSKTTRFILTCNFIERIIDPLQSRCQVLKIIPPSKNEAAQHIIHILKNESIKYELETLKSIINQHYPDIRKCVNTLQTYSNNNQLNVPENSLVSSSYLRQILKELLQPDKTNFVSIRQIINNSNINDFDELYKFLNTNIEKYAKGREAEIIIVLAEMQYKSNFRVDKEINIMSCLSQILQILQNKQIL